MDRVNCDICVAVAYRKGGFAIEQFSRKNERQKARKIKESGRMERKAIAYQNKDIISKIFGENMKNKSFRAYGMDIPEIIEILPTNLPAIEANEMRLDNLFRLKDNTIVIVDYESTYSYEDKIKYLNYVARTCCFTH